MAPAPSSPQLDAPAPAAPLPPELLPAQEAIDRGDFRQARTLLAAIRAGSPGTEVASAARTLQAATESDPWALRFGLIATGVLALLVGAYIL